MSDDLTVVSFSPLSVINVPDFLFATRIINKSKKTALIHERARTQGAWEGFFGSTCRTLFPCDIGSWDDHTTPFSSFQPEEISNLAKKMTFDS